jgi:hypothetical protein
MVEWYWLRRTEAFGNKSVHYDLFTMNHIRTALGLNLGLGGEKVATNRLVMPRSSVC